MNKYLNLLNYIVVNLLYASVTCFGHGQGGVFMKSMLQIQPSQRTNIKY